MAVPISISSPCTEKLCVIPFHTTDSSKQVFNQPLRVRVWIGHTVNWSQFCGKFSVWSSSLKILSWHLLPFNEAYHHCNSLEPWMPNSGILQSLPSTIFSYTELISHRGLKTGDYRQGKLLRWNFLLYHYHMQVQCHRIQACSFFLLYTGIYSSWCNPCVSPRRNSNRILLTS